MPIGLRGFQKGHLAFQDKKFFFKKGNHPSPSTEIKKGQRISPKTEFKKGMVPWNKGISQPPRHTTPHTEASKKLMSERRKGKYCGSKNNFWKGGHYKHDKGYVLVHVPKHPSANGGYVFQHRLVMEAQLGRYLTKEERVHHINHLREDNRIENLMLFKNHKEHMQYHKEHPEESLLTLPT